MSGKLGYEFTPTPRAAIRALEEGDLDALDYVILAAVYDRWMRGVSTVRFTLDDLCRWTNWPLEIDTLSKRLRRLRAKGWISYPKPTKKKDYRYVGTLHPEPSESGPSCEAGSEAESDAAATRTGPNIEALGPSASGAANDIAMRVQGERRRRPGPTSTDVQTNPLALEERLVHRSSRDPARAREDFGESEAAQFDRFWNESRDPAQSRAVANERAILDVLLAELSALKVEGSLQPGHELERVEGRGVVVELVEVGGEMPATSSRSAS